MSDDARDCFQKNLANVVFARKLEEQFPDDAAWSCVIRFYAALHLLNAYLIDKRNARFDPDDAAHVERRRAMECCPELRDAPKKYRELKDLSERVRYDASYSYTPERHRMSKKFLEKIIAIVEPKLKK
jgi:hypothetical protein